MDKVIKVSKPYRPSNGTEGMYFTSEFCEQCFHENPHPDKKPKCEILSLSMCFDLNDKEYPKEWVQDLDGKNPRCTKFKKWDWGNDGDPNDHDNPNFVPPVSPNQMDLPFHINKNISEIDLCPLKQGRVIVELENKGNE